MEFIYCGEVEIQNEGLVKFLEAANELQIEGLQQRGNLQKRDGSEKLLQNSTEKGSANENFFKELLPFAPTHDVKDEPFSESIENVTDPTSEELETNGRILDEQQLLEMNEVEKENYEETNKDEEEGDVIFNEVLEDSTGGLLGYQQSETSNRGFDCEYCPATFTFEDQLEDHVENEHDVKKENSDAISHLASEEPWNIDNSDSKTCKICDKIFSNKWSVQEHIDAVHENIKFLCDYCDHMSSSRRNIRGHIGKKHPDKNLPNTYTKVKSNSVKAERKEPKTPRKTKKPVKVQADQVPDKLEQDIDQKIKTMMEPKEGVWACTECGKVDKIKAAMKRHVEIHLTEFSHFCPECNKMFTTRLNLKTHRDRCHKDETANDVEENQDKPSAEEKRNISEDDAKRFKCNQCEKSPVSLPALRTHTWRAHSTHAVK